MSECLDISKCFFLHRNYWYNNRLWKCLSVYISWEIILYLLCANCHTNFWICKLSCRRKGVQSFFAKSISLISTNTLVPGFLKAKYNLVKKTIFGSRPTQHQTVSIFTFYLSFGIISLFLVPAYGFHYLEGWSYADSIYFTVISLTTIGFGDFSPSFEGSEETGIPFMAVYRILVLFWMMIGSGVRGPPRVGTGGLKRFSF